MSRLLLTRDVAERLAVSADFVRDHAHELGAIRLGAKHSPLRFPQEAVDAYLERNRVGRSGRAVPRRRPGPDRKTAFDMLPLPVDA